MKNPTVNFKILLMVLISFLLSVSCAEKKFPVKITQYTDPTAVNGIALYNSFVYCATNGGLVKWDISQGKYEIITTSNGLPSNIVKDVEVDGDGRLWVATINGSAVLDGGSWKWFGSNEGLPSNQVNTLLLDRNGTLWAGTAKGTAWYESGRFIYLNDERGPRNNPVNCLYFDDNNNLWVGTDNMGIYYRAGDTWSHFITKQGLPTATISSITQTFDKMIWSSSWAGIVRWNGKSQKWNIFSTLDVLGTSEAKYLAQGDKSLWFFTQTGVHYLGDQKWGHITRENGLLSDNTISGLVVSDEEVYIGTDEGLSVFRNGVVTNYFIPNCLNEYNSISISVDNKKRAWVGIWDGTINLFDNGFWTGIYAKDRDMLKSVRSIVYAPDSTTVFNTLNGVVFNRGEKWSLFNRNQGLAGDDIRCGVFDKDGQYWVGTGSGISYLNKKKVWKRIRKTDGLPSEDVWSCALDSTGTLWFGTTAGIVSINGDMMKNVSSTEKLEISDIRSIYVSGNKIFFGANSGKLTEYDGKSWKEHGTGYLGTDKGIISIAPDSSGAIWFGTDGDGLIRMKDGEKNHYKMVDGLPSDFVRAIACSYDEIWVACYGGVAMVKPDTEKGKNFLKK